MHYGENERRFEDGDILVMDVGARVHGYTADVSSTLQLAAFEVAATGHSSGGRRGSLRDAHQAAVRYFEAHDLRRHFPHSVGHGFGLRVHDAPIATRAIEPGMVVIIEPGLYLAEEALGVRIENCWRITEDVAELLSDAIPFHPD